MYKVSIKLITISFALILLVCAGIFSVTPVTALAQDADNQNKQVPFTVGFRFQTLRNFTQPVAPAAIIESHAALLQYFSEGLQSKLERYDDAYFKEHSLILVTNREKDRFLSRDSASANVRYVLLQQDKLLVQFPERFSAAGSIPEGLRIDWLFALEVNKSDIAGAVRVEASYMKSINVPFNVGASSFTTDYWKNDQAIIESHAALEQFFSDINKEILQSWLVRYNNAYFNERALILVKKNNRVGDLRGELLRRLLSVEVRVEQVGDTLWVQLTGPRPSNYFSVLALEVNKSDIKGVVRIVTEYSE